MGHFGNSIIKDRRIGFLTYDLQPFTEDCLNRISIVIHQNLMKAYPVFFHPNQDRVRFPFLPSQLKGRHFGVNVEGSTPEGFASNVNLKAAWECARESDIIVLFGLQGATALLTAILGSILNRTIISVNQTLPLKWELRRRWWVRLLKRFLLAQCEYHVYQTPVSKDVLMTVYRVEEDRLYYAPFEAGASGFMEVLASCEQNREGLRAILGVRDRIVFLFVGNLHVFKGVSCLIEAASLLPLGTDYECIFAGPEEPKNIVGGTIEYYKNLARKFGTEGRVRFLGSLPPPKLVEWYIASDVVVLPTQRDTFGKVLVEGGLASKPLITTSACGAAGTIVVDGENGFVVEPADPSSLSVAMSAMFDAGLRESMGRRSKKIIEMFCNRESETKGFASAILHALKT